MGATVVADRTAAEGYVAMVCFKTGPPRRLGAELEWTVHHRDDPTRQLDPATLVAALGEHTPCTLRGDSPHVPLPHGGIISLEPGGQVEISTPPHESLAELLSASAADTKQLVSLLSAADLRLGDQGCDPHRSTRRIIDTPRYAAMEHAFDRLGGHGRVMMCGTASVQVCLDAGTADRVRARWDAVHAIGPALLAAFANSPRQAVSGGWASERMRTWFGIDSTLACPPPAEADPAEGWARRALDSPLICVRRDGAGWEAPVGVTFADWIAGALPTPATYDDLDYHLSTLFPLVRPRGCYLEVRYLDAQPGSDWLVLIAIVAALFAREDTVETAAQIAAGTAGRWLPAARDGLADPVLREAASALLDLACGALADTDLTPTTISAVTESVDRRLSQGARP
jgi:glutamate--cysteine ligase